MSPMLNRLLKAVLPLLVLGVAGAGAYVMYRNRPPVETQAPVVTPPAVRVQRVAFESVDLTVTSQGTVQPRTASQIVPEIAGAVISVSPAFAVGGFFEEGDVLLEIDPYDYQQALIAAQSQLAQARLRLAQEEAEAEVARREWEELGGGDASALTLREPQVEDARAAVAAAEAAIDRARRDLERAQVRAPYAGRVQTKEVDVGQFVSRGAAVGRIYAVDSAEVRLPLPDEELAYVDVPMSYRGGRRQVGPRVVLSADFAGRRYAWEGRIARTEGEIDPMSRMVHVVAEVADPYAPGPDPSRPPLAVGMFVEAEIAGRRVDDVVVLPWAALHGRDQVLVVEDGRLHYRQVEILRSTTRSVLVRSGLSEGDLVCVSALDAVVDGMAVRIAGQEPAMARADAGGPDRGTGAGGGSPAAAPPPAPGADPAGSPGAAPPPAPGADPAGSPDAMPAGRAPADRRVAAREAPPPDRPAVAGTPAPAPRLEPFDLDPAMSRDEQIAAIRRRIAELRGAGAVPPARAAGDAAERRPAGAGRPAGRMARAEPAPPRGAPGPGNAAAGAVTAPEARAGAPGRPAGEPSRPGAGAAREDAPARTAVPAPPPPATRRASADADAPALALLPFRNVSRNPADDVIGEEMQAVVRVALERAAGLRVVLLAPEDESSAIQRAMASAATWLAGGGYQRVGERLRVTARIIDVATGGLIGSVRVDGTVTGRDALTSRLIAALRSEFAGAMPAAASPRMAAAPAAGPRPVPDAVPAPRAGDAGVRVAVSPFANISRNPADDAIGDTVAAEIAGRLRRLPGLAVLTLDAGGADGPAALAVGAARGADWLVTGGYQHVAGRLRLTARLLQVSDGAFVESVKVDGSLDGLSDMLAEAASTLGAALAAGAGS